MSEEKQPLDYHAKMREAFEVMDFKDGDTKEQVFEKVLSAAPIFKEVRDYCQGVPLFTESAERIQEFKGLIEKDFATIAERITGTFNHLIVKVTSAPTSFHITGAVVLVAPLLSDYIEEYQTQIA